MCRVGVPPAVSFPSKQQDRMILLMHRKFASCRQRLSWKAALVFIAIFGSLNYCIVPHHGSSEREKIPKATKSKTSTLRADGINSPILSSGRRLKPSIRAIPEKHWQSWKVDIAEFSQQEWDQMRTWREKNPFHRYELLSDDSAETFVQQSFYDEPEIIRNYLSLTDPILRADILRYLILYAEGGVWSDIDTKALKPVRDWIPTQYWNQFNVVIGLEIDEPGVMWLDWADNFVLCQSTMMASAGHRIYHTLIHNIIETLDALAYRQSTRLEALQLSFQDVLRITGPVAFTRVVLDYITEAAGENITRANLSGITEPKLVADVLFLPVVAFVPGQSHSNSGHSEDEAALVQHIGLGSWRETHAFDRVEYGR